MYTDALPETEEGDVDEDAMSMAHGLLAAAQRFKLERLKLMCEETLAKRIDVSTVADTLGVAEQHGCRALKAACMEFMARPGNLKAVMATEGYDKIIKDKDCTHVMLDFAIRQLARD
jgi:speckle-type POZ protein